VERGRAALVLLLLFVACTGVAIVVSGSRPGSQQGIAPTVVQFVGYVLALAAGILLWRAATGRDDRATGVMVIGGLAFLLAAEVISRGGTDIGAGFVRLVGLILVGIATVRIARGVAAERRAP
jgi:peptidoglycan/LPS O-acetylase OafA/YrhL